MGRRLPVWGALTVRSLSTKLILALLVILIATGAGFLWLAKWSSDRYAQEVRQRLNAMVAQYIVAEENFFADAAVNVAALERVAHMAMVINPAAEVYLLDAQGNILGHAQPAGQVQATRVDLGPLTRYLNGSAAPPVFGDDPRNPGRHKVFSVAEVRNDEKLDGYVYVVLGGARYDSEAARVLDSYILRTSAIGAAAIIAVALIAGLLLFRFLTRRLRLLARGLEAFEASGFREPVHIGARRSRGDEIDALARTFDSMSATIVDQITQLQVTDRTRRELIANVSHDLRTPVASMKGYLDTLLMSDADLSNEQRQRYLAVASKHGAYLAELVEDLFELSCLDSGLVQPTTEVFSLSELVQDVAQKYELQAAQARISLQPHVDAGVALVEADIGMIQQVLENLIANALRHTPASGQISVTVTPDQNMVSTMVADTGQGIPNDALPFIFDRAYSGSGPSSEPRANTGLGLAIVKRILELHHASIRVTSQVGRGTAFRFDLPIASP